MKAQAAGKLRLNDWPQARPALADHVDDKNLIGVECKAGTGASITVTLPAARVAG